MCFKVVSVVLLVFVLGLVIEVVREFYGLCGWGFVVFVVKEVKIEVFVNNVLNNDVLKVE